MKLFLRLWGGHLLLVPTIVAAGLTLLFARNSMAGENDTAVIWNFVIAVMSLALMLLLAGLSAWFWNDARDRYYISRTRRSDAMIGARVPSPSGPWIDPVYAPHSADDGWSSDGE